MYSLDRMVVNLNAIDLVGFNDKTIVFGTCMAKGFVKNLQQYNLDCSALPANNAIHALPSFSVLLDFITGKNDPLERYCIQDVSTAGIRFLPFGLSCENIFDDHAQLGQSLSNELESYKTEIELADNIVIFIGTTRVIRLREGGCIINRVDGLPGEQWDSRQTSVAENVALLENVIQTIGMLNPRARIILAVDPQRYLFKFVDDPTSDNILAKSILICSISTVVAAHDHVHYFKSYEIVSEELKHCEYINEKDLTHINETTLNHLAYSFLMSFAKTELRKDIQTAAGHKLPFAEQLAHLKTIPQALAKRVNMEMDGNDYFHFPIHLLPQARIIQIRHVATLCRRDDIIEAIDRCCERIIRIPNDTPFYVWGTGGRMKNTIAKYLDGRDNFLGFIDNNKALHGTSVLGHQVHAPEVLTDVRQATIFIASTYFDSIRRQIFNLNQGIAVKNIPTHL